MTLAYIYDRTRPLAERVQDAIDAIICERDWGNTTEAEEAALSEVIADIAAARCSSRAARQARVAEAIGESPQSSQTTLGGFVSSPQTAQCLDR